MQWSVGLGIGLFLTGAVLAGLIPSDLSREMERLQGLHVAFTQGGNHERLIRIAGSPRSRGRGNSAPNTGAVDPCQLSATESVADTTSLGQRDRDRVQRSAKARVSGSSGRGKPGTAPTQSGGTPTADCASNAGPGDGGAAPVADGTSGNANGPDTTPSPVEDPSRTRMVPESPTSDRPMQRRRSAEGWITLKAASRPTWRTSRRRGRASTHCRVLCRA